VLMAGAVVLAWLYSPVGIFQGPMNQLANLAHPHMHMGHGLVRLVAVAFITAASYLLLEVVPRQIIEYWNIQRFFQTAVPYSDEPITGEPAGDATQDKLTSLLPEGAGVTLIPTGVK